MDSNNKQDRGPEFEAQDEKNSPNKESGNIIINIDKDAKIFSSIIRVVIVGILLYAALTNLNWVGNAIKTLFSVLNPLMIGVLLAMVLNAPMTGLTNVFTALSHKLFKKRKPHQRLIEILALVITFLLAFLILYIVGNTVIPQLVKSAEAIFTTIQKNFIPEVIKTLNDLEKNFGINTDSIVEWFSKLNLEEIIKQFTTNAVSLINTIISSASSIFTGLLTALTAIVFAIYSLANKRTLARQGKKMGYAFLKKSFVDKTIEVLTLASRTLTNFIAGQCLDAVILGVLMFITMSIFSFPYALAISALITVTAIIPYVGAFLGGAFGFLLMIFDDPENFVRALLFVVLFIVVQQIDNHLIYPRVVGSSVGLPAIWTFAAVIVGGSVWGIIGMILFIPLFSVIYTLLRRNVLERLNKRGITVTDAPGEAVVSDEERPEAKPFPLKEKFDKLLAKLVGLGKNQPKNEAEDGEEADKPADEE